MSTSELGQVELERMAQVVEAIDLRLAARPDILAGPAGFMLGALIGAARTDPIDTYRQLEGITNVLAYLVMYVQGAPGYELEPLVDAFATTAPV